MLAVPILWLLLLFTLPATSYAACTSSATPPTKDANGKVTPGTVATQGEISSCLKNDPIVGDLQKIVDVLSAGVGIAVTGVIILGGVQYSMAGDKAEAVTAAKKRIYNGLIALVAFLFLAAFLQWLIPGGAFSG